MAIYYDKWYRLYGIRQPNQLISPIITDGELFEFPVGTRFHWYKPTEKDTFIDKDISYLNKTEKVVVDTIVEYPENVNMSGNFNKIGRSIFKVIEEAAQKEPDFDFLKYRQTKTYNEKTLNIYTYGNLSAFYKYPTAPFRNVDIIKNCLRTMISHLGKSERQDIILIELPKNIPSRVELDRYSLDLKVSYLPKLPSFKYFMLLEIWKLMTPELRGRSLLNDIPSSCFSKIDFMFVYNDKIAILNFEKLYYLVKEYRPENYKSNFTGFKAGIARKIFFMFLYNLIANGVSKSEKDVLASLTVSGFKDAPKKDINVTDAIKPDKEVEEEIEENIKEKNISNVAEEDKLDVKVLEDDDIVDEEPVDDSILELQALLDESVDNIEDATTYTLDSIKEDFYKFDNVKKVADKLKSDTVISKKQNNDIIKILDQQENLTVPYSKTIKLKEVLDYSMDNYEIDPAKVTHTPVNTIFDQKSNITTTQAMHKEYLTKQYRKDVTRTLYSLQNFNLAIENYEIRSEHTLMDSTETHKLKVKFPTGGTANLSFVLPKVADDGTMLRYGGKYLSRYLRTDLPIRKIDYNNVVISSGYGRAFITKGEMSYDNKGNWLANKIKKSDNDQVYDVILGENENMGIKLPTEYALLGRCIKSLKIGKAKYAFNYADRISLIGNLTEDGLHTLEKDGLILIGVENNKPIMIREDNKYFKFDGKNYIEIPGIVEQIGIDLNDGPIEFVSMRIFKKIVPLVVMLSYYIGFTSLLKTLGVQFTYIDEPKRVIAKKDEYVIRFANATYVIKRDNGIGDLILGGFVKLKPIIQNIPRETVEKKDNFSLLFSRLDYSLSYVTEIRIMESMFVDPVTLSILKENNMPTNFKGILIKATEMLVDDNYENPNDIKGSRIRGYDRIPTMLYKEMIQALRVKENTAAFGKQTMLVNPYTVYNKIFDDSTTVLVDDLNPMAYIKQTEDVSQVGDSGRSKVGMSKGTRIMDTTEIGVMSEAAKDSSDVGITGYLTANPKIKSIRGDIGDFDIKQDGWASAVSTSAMLAPFGLMDDTKRLNFSSIMRSHVVPINGMKVPYVRTGYESIIPLKAGNKFVISALEEGTVIHSKKESIEVQYKTLGKVKYKITDWTSKEESDACYTHVMKSDLKSGDEFKKDDTLVYDSTFFGMDIFNPGRVIYREGDIITIALTEDPQTYEDSASISRKISTRLGTTMTKVINVIMDVKDNISDIVKPGDKVLPSDPVLIITNQVLGGVDMDKKALDIMSSLNKQAPKAKYKGVINKIDIRYNAELEDMSKSVKDLVEKIDKISLERYGYTNKVNDSYSHQGKPLLNGTILIKVYLDVEYGMGIGDKAIFGNQLKFTVGEVYENDVRSEGGIEIEGFFSSRSIAARIVNSPYMLGTVSMLLDKLGELAVKEYFS